MCESNEAFSNYTSTLATVEFKALILSSTSDPRTETDKNIEISLLFIKLQIYSHSLLHITGEKKLIVTVNITCFGNT